MIKTLLFTLLKALEPVLMVLPCPCCTGTGHQPHLQAAVDGREEAFNHQQDPTGVAPHLGLLARMEVTVLQGHFGSATLHTAAP